jgi:ribosomal protein S12 methylthiotransferase accessory factor
MGHQTFPDGKDASLETTIERATSILKRINLFPQAMSWLNPAPGCWSVHLRHKKYPFLYTNGKGISRKSALASGLGEFIERLATGFFFEDYFIEEGEEKKSYLYFQDEQWFSGLKGSRLELLSAELLNFYNPNGDLQPRHLQDHNTRCLHKRICCLPFSNLETEETVNFPVALLHNLYVSNGMAAGNSWKECLAQALSEIIERYVKNQVIANGLTLPDIPEQFLQDSSPVSTILNRLRKHGYRVAVKDSSLGGKFPVICVLLINPENGGVFASFGASPRFETAMERTLTELLQGRQLDHFSHFQPPVYDLSLTGESYNLESHFINSDGLLPWQMFQDKSTYIFSPWDFSGTTAKEVQYLQNIIQSSGFTIYYREYNQLGMPVCRIIVPGMSEIYPVDDLVWNNKNKTASLRGLLLRLPELEDSELAAIINILDETTPDPHQPVSELIGVLFDKNSGWCNLSVGELKAHIFLALNRHQDSSEWYRWCLEYAPLVPFKKQIFRAIHTLLECRLAGENSENYEKWFFSFFTEKNVRQAKQIVDGNSKFPWLSFAPAWRNLSEKHNELLILYKHIKQSTK